MIGGIAFLLWRRKKTPEVFTTEKNAHTMVEMPGHEQAWEMPGREQAWEMPVHEQVWEMSAEAPRQHR